jgi:L-alanine-DL-glutamate epimerase-like enolase superfamily enzyme
MNPSFHHAALIGKKVSVVEQPYIVMTVAEDPAVLIHISTKDGIHHVDNAECTLARVMAEDGHPSAIKFIVIGQDVGIISRKINKIIRGQSLSVLLFAVFLP